MYAKLTELKAGDYVQVDSGFTCMSGGDTKIVNQDKDGLWIACADGSHHLIGQVDNQGYFVGIFKCK